MSFFCLDAGRISSRSTGTPSETRKRRRVRDRIQSGGARGGGATNCDHKEADRGVKKTEESFGRGGNEGKSSFSTGNSVPRYGSVVEITPSESRSSKSGMS